MSSTTASMEQCRHHSVCIDFALAFSRPTSSLQRRARWILTIALEAHETSPSMHNCNESVVVALLLACFPIFFKWLLFFRFGGELRTCQRIVACGGSGSVIAAQDVVVFDIYSPGTVPDLVTEGKCQQLNIRFGKLFLNARVCQVTGRSIWCGRSGGPKLCSGPICSLYFYEAPSAPQLEYLNCTAVFCRDPGFQSDGTSGRKPFFLLWVCWKM